MSLFLFKDEPWALLLPWPDLSYSLLWYGGKPGCGGQGACSPTRVLHLPHSAHLNSQLSWQRQGLGTSPLGWREHRTTCVPCPSGKAPATGFGKPANSFWWFSQDTCRSWLFLFSVTSRPLASATEAATPALIHRILFACGPCQLRADPTV